jgi:hypothetical protein
MKTASLVASMVAISMAIILLTVATSGALSASRTVSLDGTITAVNVEVYSNAACTQLCTTLNLGTVSPGSSVTQNIWIKNTGTVPVTLSMAASSWNPSTASSYLTLSWNRAGYVLNAGLSVQATLTLTAASNTGSLTTFSLSATITGTE